MAESNVPPNKANTLVRTIVVTPEDGSGGKGPAFLIVEIEIDCAVCGQHAHTFAGHHLASLAASFQQIVEEHGKLAGKQGQKVAEEHWEADFDPGKVGLN